MREKIIFAPPAFHNTWLKCTQCLEWGQLYTVRVKVYGLGLKWIYVILIPINYHDLLIKEFFLEIALFPFLFLNI